MFFKKFFSFALITTVISILAPMAAVQAIGQTTEPIVITNALRGESFRDTLIIVNTEQSASNIAVEAEGDIAPWAFFYLPQDEDKGDDFRATTTQLTLAAGERANVNVVFNIPADTPNGEYTGYVSAKKLAPEQAESDESGTSVSQRIDREVTIVVSDEEDIKLDVSVIPKSYDISKGEALSVRFIYDNTGNVSLKPEIKLTLKTEEKTLYSLSFPYPENESAVIPHSLHEIPAIELPTASLENGRYYVTAEFLRDNTTISEKEFYFNVGSGKGLVSGIKIFGEGSSLLVKIALLVLVIIIIGAGVKITMMKKEKASKNVSKPAKKKSKREFQL
ncbi:MAG: hypothetical protein Q8Q23_05880 [bacterium]|nr:hypothetical protein [bacterium]